MKIITRFSIHPKDGVGGAERQMMLIAKELIKDGVNFHYIFRRYKKNQKKYEIINGVKIHGLGSLINIKNSKLKCIMGIINKIIYTDIILFFKYFLKFDYDIYHFRGAPLLKSYWPLFAKIIKRKKLIYTTAHIWDCIPNFLPWRDRKLDLKIYKYFIKRADIVIVLAEYMKKALYENYGVKSIVIKSGHPVPKGPFKKDNPPTISWISRLIDWKRPELFLEIAKVLEDLDINFLLIGPEDYMKKKIMRFADKHKNFTFIPGVPFGKDNYYYEKAALLVNTSIYEGFPNTFIQAWLRKTPVISLDVDPDYVICKNGLGYHAKGNFNELINKIKELIENPSKLKEMGEKCRKYAIKNHDIKKTAQQHYKLYKWLLKEKRK